NSSWRGKAVPFRAPGSAVGVVRGSSGVTRWRSWGDEFGAVALLADQHGVGPVATNLGRLLALRTQRAQAQMVEATDVQLRLDHAGCLHQTAVVQQAVVAPHLELHATGLAALV